MPTLGKNSVFKLDNSSGTLTDLSQYITDVSGINNTTAMIDSTTFGDSSLENFPGLRNGDAITISGIWETALNTHFTALLSNSATRTWEYSPAGTAASTPKVSGECYVESYVVTSAVADTVKFTATLRQTGDVTWGTN